MTTISFMLHINVNLDRIIICCALSTHQIKLFTSIKLLILSQTIIRSSKFIHMGKPTALTMKTE